MNVPDIKKLITGFLILAALAGSSALLFSPSSGSAPRAAQTPQNFAAGQALRLGSGQVPKNAFVERVPDSGSAPEGEDVGAIRVASGNLTENFARSLAEQIRQANPSGPQTTADGQIGALAPDMDTLTQSLENTLNDPQTLAQVMAELPEDDAPASPNVLDSSAPADIVGYIRALNEIIDAGASENPAGGVPGDSLGAVNAIEVLMSQRVLRMKNLRVPKPLVNFHLAAFSLFQKAGRMMTIALGGNGSGDDPLKQLALVEMYSHRIDDAMEIYGNEAEKAQAMLEQISLAPLPRVSIHEDSLMKTFFGANVVHAANPLSEAAGSFAGGAAACWLGPKLTDLINSIAKKLSKEAGDAILKLGTEVTSVPVKDVTVGKAVGENTKASNKNASLSLVDCLRVAATDSLKNTLIHKIIQQTIVWIQGGYKGAPQFVTDWDNFLGSAGSAAAGNAIDKIAPGLCRPWRPLLRMQLESTYLAEIPLRCTLDEVVANAKEFYNDFTQGGWLGYQAMVLPSGNFFGQFLEGSQIVAAEEFAAREQAKAEANQGGGFIPQTICVNPIMVSEYDKCVAQAIDACESSNANAPRGSLPIDCRHGAAAQCSGASQVKQRECAPNGTIVTTPGQAIGHLAYEALSAPLQQIVNAQDLAALLSALINSGFDQLTKLTKKRSPNESGLLGIQLEAGKDDAAIDACAKLKGDAQIACLEKIVITPPAPTPAPTSTPPEDSRENCPLDCVCKGRDLGGTEPNMCFKDDVMDAMDAVVAEGEKNGLETVGLTREGCLPSDDICALPDSNLFGEKVKAVLEATGAGRFTVAITEEVEVTGSCEQVTCSATRPGVCVGPGMRYEGIDIIAYGGGLRRYGGVAVCPR